MTSKSGRITLPLAIASALLVVTSLAGCSSGGLPGGGAGTAGTGAFVGTVSGPASVPVVNGTMSGEWKAYGPLTK